MFVREPGVADYFSREIPEYLCRRLAECGRAKFIGGIGPKCRANHRATRRERTSRPPDVERGNVSVANGFLAPRMGGDAFDGQVNFDEAFGVWGHD